MRVSGRGPASLGPLDAGRRGLPRGLVPRLGPGCHGDLVGRRHGSAGHAVVPLLRMPDGRPILRGSRRNPPDQATPRGFRGFTTSPRECPGSVAPGIPAGSRNRNSGPPCHRRFLLPVARRTADTLATFNTPGFPRFCRPIFQDSHPYVSRRSRIPKNRARPFFCRNMPLFLFSPERH